MKFFKVAYPPIIALLAIFLLITNPAVSQETAAEDTPEQDTSSVFFLIPILETVFSGDVTWRPDWPEHIPPDAFFVNYESRLPLIIELSNETETYLVRRNSEGRLLEFPFFFENGYAKVQVVYAASGALRSMNVTLKNNTSDEDGDQDQEDSGQDQTEKTLNISFPVNFFPYSDLSLGGSFLPITVNSDDASFFVFVFESPLFFAETWYDQDGNMLAYCGASVNVENGKWRIRSLQINDADGTRFTDYFYDSFGNITEINLEDRTFSAFFRDKRPTSWRWNGCQYDFQWDTRGILTIIKATDENDGFLAEYRYEYGLDTSGNWVRRQETAYIIQFDLLAPNSSSGRGIWNRRIVY